MGSRSKVRFGIVGCGRIAARLARGVRATPGAELYAVASRSLSKARAAARKWSAEKHYGAYDQMLRDDRIDAVYVALPNDLHCAWSIRAIEAGKHVLCEKPLAMNAAEARQMARAARKHNVLLMEAFMYRYHKHIRKALKLVAAGKIGRVMTVHAAFGGVFSQGSGEYRSKRSAGGGSLYDLGCYCVNAGRLFFADEPRDATGVAVMTRRGGIDMQFSGTLRFAGGGILSFVSSFGSVLGQRVVIAGDRGQICMSPFTPGKNVTFTALTGSRRTTVNLETWDAYEMEVRHLVKSIRCGELLAPAEDGTANMRAIDMLKKAASW